MATAVLEPEPEAAPSALSAAARFRIIAYFGGLIVLMGFPGSIIGVPVGFFLKNKLHLAAHQVAIFGLISSIPVYFAVAFGFTRDVWSPFGWGDRGYLVLFGAFGAALAAGFAFAPPTYAALMGASLLLAVCGLFLRSAQRGLMATMGQQHVMTGQVAAAANTFDSVPTIVGLLAGGLVSNIMEGDRAAEGAHLFFLVGAAFLGAIGLYGLLRPRVVFDNVHHELKPTARLRDDLIRLVRHWPLYPALLIWLLWQFVPGFGTPLQYFLQDSLKFSDFQYTIWFALYYGGGIPGFVLYGFLCQRFALRTLLFWGVAAATPMMLPLLIIHGLSGALVIAPLMGALAGVGAAAIFDLIIRSCPKGLQGSMLMAVTGVLAVDGSLGDVLGTSLYDHFHNFTVCVIAMTITNALVLPAILLVPRRLISTPDGVASTAGPSLAEPEPPIASAQRG
jgi:Na+/melibiose symporter-like transporter